MDCERCQYKSAEEPTGNDSRVEGCNGVGLASDEVVETVGSGCVDEAVAYPLGSLDAAAVIKPRSPKITRQNTYLSEISAMSSNASSTPSLTFAEVSMNLIPSSAASSRPCSSVTARLSVQSDLLPMRILLTPSEACCSIFACHVLMSTETLHEHYG